VLCLDEFGPLEIRPQLGENWGIKPNLVPATYTRDKGVRHLIAFLDFSSDRLYGHIKKRKRWERVTAYSKVHPVSLSRKALYYTRQLQSAYKR
jgi:hypothetical protein